MNSTPRLAFAGGCLLACSLAFSGTSHGTESAAITIAGKPVSKDNLLLAIHVCQEAPASTVLDCLKTDWVPRFQLDAEARSRRIDESPAFHHQAQDILHIALVRLLASEQPEPSPSDIDDYIERHRRDFQKPLRIRLFRILLDTREQAKNVLTNLQGKTSVEDFRQLARKHSIDRATSERGGDLGYVWPNGSTDVPQVSAEKSLYVAGLELSDGQIAAEPVPEGQRFAVLFRGGSLPAVPLSEESRKIARLRLLEAGTEADVQKLLVRLMEKDVHGREDVLLGKLRRKGTRLFDER